MWLTHLKLPLSVIRGDRFTFIPSTAYHATKVKSLPKSYPELSWRRKSVSRHIMTKSGGDNFTADGCAAAATNSVAFFVLGAPGSGKGTQCKLLSDKFQLVHISAGEMIRKEKNDLDSPFRQPIIDAITVPGGIVPSEITCHLIRSSMNSFSGKHFLIDAFPVNSSNLYAWKAADLLEPVTVPFTLFFEIDEEQSISRCLDRKREDDSERNLHARFQTYLKQTKPVIDEFEKSGTLRKIDAKRTVDEIFADVAQLFEQYCLRRKSY